MKLLPHAAPSPDSSHTGNPSRGECAPTASALAAQQFGRDGVTVEPEKQLRGTPVTVEIKRVGRDSVFITKDSVISRPNPTKFTDVSFKPGRG